MSNWTLDSIAWDLFDASKVDAEILRNIKAAAMVERNGSDYGVYLGRVFADDPAFAAEIKRWAGEEVQHGMALGRWAQLADPSWDFDAAFARFRKGYQLPLDATGSVRGSQAGEMMARCIVETGTSSYYSALKDATEEPVLKQICTNIAADEFRHYKLFFDHLGRCLERDRLSRWARLRVGWGRLAESEDDELAYAYFAANEPDGSVYDRKRATDAYARRAYPLYRRFHVQRAMAMMLKAVGLAPNGRLNALLTRVGLWFLRRRSIQLAQQGA
jgi:rubrerythrin